jgi:hypothetical protein
VVAASQRAAAYRGAKKVAIRYVKLSHGDRRPECTRGNVYVQKPKVLARIVDQAPLAATVYELERLRCNACGQVFTAEEPKAWAGEVRRDGLGHIAQLKYSGRGALPTNRPRAAMLTIESARRQKRVDNRAAGQRSLGHLCCDIGCRSLTAKL